MNGDQIRVTWDQFDSPLHKAAESDIDGRDWEEATPLIRAVADQAFEVVDELLGRKADVHAVDEHGRSALHYAVWTGITVLIEKLLNAGIGIMVRDNHDETPLHYAAQMWHLNAVKFLLSTGADPKDRTTPVSSWML